MPRFILMFAGSTYPLVYVRVGGTWQHHGSHPCSQPTLHLYGKKDVFLEMDELECKNYPHLIKVVHEEGHKIPTRLSPEQLTVVTEFIRRQYFTKNGTPNNGPKL
jgi:hypothetical protein